MSDLRKKLAQKNRTAFGMEAVPEIPQDLNHPHELVADDDEVLAKFHQAKNATFAFQDRYVVDGKSFQTYYMPPLMPQGPVFFCHHGAGSSALTFYSLAVSVRDECKANESVGLFSFDARGHGTSWKPDPADYSLESLTGDVNAVFQEFCRRHVTSNAVYFVGHSLGGAILTNFISCGMITSYCIKGLAVLDIVEETAIRALSSISLFLNKRPDLFECYADAFRWHHLLHLLRNENSSAISVVDLLYRDSDGTLTWRADMASMNGYWDSWFVNLSDRFVTCGSGLKVKMAKLLILSGNDTLDKNLIIGQMQGKYQLIVFNNTATGHFIHEDAPKQTAVTLLEFVRRNGFSAIGEEEIIQSRWGGKINQ